MSCREVIEFLSAYLDGELAAGVRREFEAHLAACPACFTYLETYEETVKLAKAASAEALPAEVPEELVKAILAARRKK